MNLFVLDLDFEVNVQYHVDDHVNKIALECCQVLSTALWLRNQSNVAYDASIWYQRGLEGCDPASDVRSRARQQDAQCSR